MICNVLLSVITEMGWRRDEITTFSIKHQTRFNEIGKIIFCDIVTITKRPYETFLSLEQIGFCSFKLQHNSIFRK